MDSLKTTRNFTAKVVKILLRDNEGKAYYWTVRHKKAWACTPDGILSKSRWLTGWEYESHDGCVRFQEGNWLNVVYHIKLTAENYGFIICSDL